MNNIKVKLIADSGINVFIDAVRTCWDSHNKCDTIGDDVGENDKVLIDRIVHKHKHHSTLEHLFYNFEITGISRLCLQELARHRIASFSVKSTRYTLKELKGSNISTLEDASKYIVLTGNKLVDDASHRNLKELHNLVNTNGITQDYAKYCLPECYRTSLRFSLNARSLRNLLELRLSKGAHFEIRHLAKLLYKSLPDLHKELIFNDLEPLVQS